MGFILNDLRTFIKLRRGNSAFNVNTQQLLSNYNWRTGKPSWISLTTPQDFENAVRHNPVVKAAINLLAKSSSNGRKVAVDIKTGEVIDWNTNEATKHAYKLLVLRPNPLQSGKQFEFQGRFYIETFGNRYVRANMPIGMDKKIDLLNIQTLFNLPSQFVEVKTTGKLYDQIDLKGIIEYYALNNYNPIKKYSPEEIIHFNKVNISSEMATIMGISPLEVLKMPITNTQMAFEAMNTILKHRGAQGIIFPRKTDGQGGSISLTPGEKKDAKDLYKEDYGLLSNQSPFKLAPFPMDYIKTIMNSKELGIYEEFSSNAGMIANELGVPLALIKTYIGDSTYQNLIQEVRRLYQDTTMPMVAEEDIEWTDRLNTTEYDFRIETRWDHIPALSLNKKENAMTLNLKGRTAKEAYDNNTITVNEYRELIEKKPVDGGDVYKVEWDKKNKVNQNQNNGNE